MPSVFGKDSKKKELIANLQEIYTAIEREHQISPGDFPKIKKMQVKTLNHVLLISLLFFCFCQSTLFNVILMICSF